MKILVLLITILISCLDPPNKVIVNASTDYARAISSVNLYKIADNTDVFTDIICIIEKTYFVEIISEYKDYYKVNYNNITGYVKKADVVLVKDKPTTPFPNNIKITMGKTCNLRSTPTTKSSTSNIISTINSGETNIEFIGRIFAEEAMDFCGTTWYYVKYNNNYGYIYNQYIKNITPIYENKEISIEKDNININTDNPINNVTSIILVAILILPSIIILFILYLPRKIKSNNKQIKIIDKY